jgi:hypothetical protein
MSLNGYGLFKRRSCYDASRLKVYKVHALAMVIHQFSRHEIVLLSRIQMYHINLNRRNAWKLMIVDDLSRLRVLHNTAWASFHGELSLFGGTETSIITKMIFKMWCGSQLGRPATMQYHLSTSMILFS